MKTKMKIKNKSHRYGIDRPKSGMDQNIVNIKSASV